MKNPLDFYSSHMQGDHENDDLINGLSGKVNALKSVKF